MLESERGISALLVADSCSSWWWCRVIVHGIVRAAAAAGSDTRVCFEPAAPLL